MPDDGTRQIVLEVDEAGVVIVTPPPCWVPACERLPTDEERSVPFIAGRCPDATGGIHFGPYDGEWLCEICMATYDEIEQWFDLPLPVTSGAEAKS